MKCSGARILVWSAIGALVLLLILALSALDERNEAVSQLQRAIDDLSSKDQQLDDERGRAAKFESDYDVAKSQARDFEERSGRLKDDLVRKSGELDSMGKEADRQRQKARNNWEFDTLRGLDALSRADLEDKMHKDAQDLWAVVERLKAASPEADATIGELRSQGEALRDAFEKLRAVIDDGEEEGDDDAVETFEISVEELENLALKAERHAKNNPQAWENPADAKEVARLLKLLELDVEAFDEQMDQTHLEADEAELKSIDDMAQAEGEDDEFAAKVKGEEQKLEGLRKRLYDESHQGDEEEEIDAAEALEEEAEEAEAALEGWEQQYVENGQEGQSPDQVEKRNALDKAFHTEVYRLEQEAADIEEDLERRAIRADELEGERAADQLKEQDSFQKLDHAQEAISETAKIDKLEEQLMEELRKKEPDEDTVDRLSRQIEEATDALDEDAERLWDEADAADIDDMDEREMDKQIARELEDAARKEHKDVEEAADDLHEREIRERAEHIQGDVNRIPDASLKREHARGFKQRAEQLNTDADVLNREIGENDLSGEEAALKKLQQDIAEVKAEEDAFENEAREDSSENEADTAQDIKLGQEVDKEVDALESEAQKVQNQIQEERLQRAKHLKEQLASVEEVQQGQQVVG